jgi:hypothetical protein
MVSQLLHWVLGRSFVCRKGREVTSDRQRLDEVDRFPKPVWVKTPTDVTDKGMNNSN